MERPVSERVCVGAAGQDNKNKNKSKASGQVSILLTSRMTISRSPKVLVAGGI